MARLSDLQAKAHLQAGAAESTLNTVRLELSGRQEPRQALPSVQAAGELATADGLDRSGKRKRLTPMGWVRRGAGLYVVGIALSGMAAVLADAKLRSELRTAVTNAGLPSMARAALASTGMAQPGSSPVSTVPAGGSPVRTIGSGSPVATVGAGSPAQPVAPVDTGPVTTLSSLPAAIPSAGVPVAPARSDDPAGKKGKKKRQ